MCTYRSRRNEHAVDLATKTFCKRFDRMFGLRKNNQEQIQDVTGHMNLKSEVDANCFEPPQRSLSKRFCKNLENVCSERGSLKENDFDKLLPIALEEATKVLETNAITSNDDDLKKLSKRLKDDCTYKFYKHYKPINNDRRKSWKRTMITLGALTIVTCGGFLAGVVGAAAIDALQTGFNSSTVASATADKNSNENPVETGAGIGSNSPVVSNGLSDDVVITDPEEMLHLEIPDDQNSLDGMLNTIEASPEFKRIWARVSELCRQRGMEFDDEMKAGLPHWYAQRRIKNLKNMACPILYMYI